VDDVCDVGIEELSLPSAFEASFPNSPNKFWSLLSDGDLMGDKIKKPPRVRMSQQRYLDEQTHSFFGEDGAKRDGLDTDLFGINTELRPHVAPSQASGSDIRKILTKCLARSTSPSRNTVTDCLALSSLLNDKNIDLQQKNGARSLVREVSSKQKLFA
jgi:hypothetical protein